MTDGGNQIGELGRFHGAILGAFRLELTALEETVFPGNPTEALHGALHRAVERLDPALSERLHAASPTPLVCAPLVDERGELAPSRLRAGARVSVRIAALSGEVLVALLAALDGLRARGLPMIVERPFRVDAVLPGIAERGALPWIAYGDLAALAGPSDTVTLRFRTPTYFRSGGAFRTDPAPERVFSSHLRRWRAFAGFDLPGVDDGAIAGGVLLVGNPEGSIVPVTLFRHREAGFVGTARYRVTGDDALRRGIAVLAAYAAYCGTGTRTALGMGQTERIGIARPPEPPAWVV